MSDQEGTTHLESLVRQRQTHARILEMVDRERLKTLRTLKELEESVSLPKEAVPVQGNLV